MLGFQNVACDAFLFCFSKAKNNCNSKMDKVHKPHERTKNKSFAHFRSLVGLWSNTHPSQRSWTKEEILWWASKCIIPGVQAMYHSALHVFTNQTPLHLSWATSCIPKLMKPLVKDDEVLQNIVKQLVKSFGPVQAQDVRNVQLNAQVPVDTTQNVITSLSASSASTSTSSSSASTSLKRTSMQDSETDESVKRVKLDTHKFANSLP